MPSNDGLRLHNEELVLPAPVETPHENPEDPLTVGDAGPLGGAPQDNNLLLQRNVLGNQLRLSRSQCHDEVEEMMYVLHLLGVPGRPRRHENMGRLASKSA